MGVTNWIIDKSALVRVAVSPDGEAWLNRMDQGLVRITTVTHLEIGYSARSGVDLRAGMRRPPLSLLQIEYLTPTVEGRAVEVQAMLADRGHHRAPSAADLLIAAAGEIIGLTVLHLDKDFELIAEVTGQPMERLRIDT
ncbi:PIN domain nuclease [Nocardia macrotermitis]|nr:PIN domain nuclease [Nocardia macrotermitis]